jgi:acyl carrier protein
MTATMEQLDKATEIFCEVMGVEASQVSDATAYASFGPWDSLKHMEMVARFEAAFGLDIDIEDVIGMETLGRIKEILTSYIAERS